MTRRELVLFILGAVFFFVVITYAVNNIQTHGGLKAVVEQIWYGK